MKFQEILSFLENEEKRNRLIYKLKNEGKNSSQIHAFQEIITSLNLHKSPPGVHQETLLQNTFRFCEVKECFQNFRLVSKSWKHAIENMRFNQCMELNENLEFENDGQFTTFDAKYVQAFKAVELILDEEALEKWIPFCSFILENVEKINYLEFQSHQPDSLPLNFDSFLLELLKKSQITLKEFYFETNNFIQLPMISLPNVTKITQHLIPEQNNQISSFDIFMKRIIQSCPYLELLSIDDVHECPNIANYITEHYSQHCVESVNIESSKILPVRMAYYSDLRDLEVSSYPSSLEYIQLDMDDLNSPFGEDWRDYKSIFALCPKLKGITISDENEIYLNEDFPNDMSSENQNIWKTRISYLKSNGIKLMSDEEYDSKFEELRKKTKWGFQFWLSEED